MGEPSEGKGMTEKISGGGGGKERQGKGAQLSMLGLGGNLEVDMGNHQEQGMLAGVCD